MYLYEMKRSNIKLKKCVTTCSMDPNSLINSLDVLVADCLRTFVEKQWIDEKTKLNNSYSEKINSPFHYKESDFILTERSYDCNTEKCSRDVQLFKGKYDSFSLSLPSTAAVTPIGTTAFPSRSNTSHNSFSDTPDTLLSPPLDQLACKLFIDQESNTEKNHVEFFANDYLFDWTEEICENNNESDLALKENNHLNEERLIGRKVLHSAWNRPFTNNLNNNGTNIYKMKDAFPRRRVLLRRGRTLVEDVKTVAELHYNDDFFFKDKSNRYSGCSTGVSRFDEIISSFIVHCYWGRNLILEIIRQRCVNLLLQAAEEISKNEKAELKTKNSDGTSSSEVSKRKVKKKILRSTALQKKGRVKKAHKTVVAPGVKCNYKKQMNKSNLISPIKLKALPVVCEKYIEADDIIAEAECAINSDNELIKKKKALKKFCEKNVGLR